MKKFLFALSLLFALITTIALTSDEEQIARLENGLVRSDGSTRTIHEAMQQHGIAGISIAVINDYEITWTKGYGLREADKSAPATADTLFSCGSISKSVFAVLCVVLEEKGLLDLEAPVQTYLKSWTFPENEYTENATISLRRLLSHSAGTTVHGFPDFYKGDTVPTLVQILNGEPPAKTPKVYVDIPVGSQYRYSGGGYQVAQLAVEDHLGKSIEALAEEHIFAPLGMKDATYQLYGSAGFPENIAAAHDRAGKPLRGRFPICPEQAASGLWSTTRDLALLVIDIQKALAGKESKVVSKAAAQRLTTVVLGDYAIGVRIRENNFGGKSFDHSGSNDGIGGFYFGTMEGGNGMVILAGGIDRADIMGDIGRGLSKIYGWMHKQAE